MKKNNLAKRGLLYPKWCVVYSADNPCFISTTQIQTIDIYVCFVSKGRILSINIACFKTIIDASFSTIHLTQNNVIKFSLIIILGKIKHRTEIPMNNVVVQYL